MGQTRVCNGGTMKAGGNTITVKQLCFSFKGRINRPIYWGCVVSITVVCLATVTFVYWLLEDDFYDFVAYFIVFSILSSLFVLLAVTVKRFHDTNRSGVHVLIVLLPAIGLVYLLMVCGFLKGTEGENDYGPPVDKIY